LHDARDDEAPDDARHAISAAATESRWVRSGRVLRAAWSDHRQDDARMQEMPHAL
jgi:hypothetical protein